MNFMYEVGELKLTPMNQNVYRMRSKISEKEHESNPHRYEKWMLDQDVTEHNSHGLFKKSKQEIESWLDECENSKSSIHFAIYKSDEWIGMISLQKIDYINSSAEIAIYIGEKKYWGRGYAKVAVKTAVKHAVLKLCLRRVWSGTAETNIGMQKVFDSLKFKHEGTFKHAMYLDGLFVDVYAYGYVHSFLNSVWLSDES